MSGKNGYLGLIWLQWRISKKGYVMTLVYILLPFILCIGLMLMRWYEGLGKVIEEGKLSYPIPYKELFGKHIENRKLDLLFSPNSNVTVELMLEVKRQFRDEQINTLKGFDNSEDIEQWFVKNDYMERFFAPKIGYAIIFESVTDKLFNYTLRSAATVEWHTQLLFPEAQLPGPRESANMYFKEGFVTLQAALNIAYTKRIGLNQVDWQIQEFPYPPYRQESSYKGINIRLLAVLFCFGYFFVFDRAIVQCVQDKESGLREIIKFNGISNYVIYQCRFLYYIILCSLSITVITIILKTASPYPILEYSDPLLLWIFFMFYCSSIILYAFAVSSFFSKTFRASMYGALFYFTPYFLFTQFNSGKGTTFHPVGALLKGVEIIDVLEASQEGVQFDNIFYEFPNLSVLPMMDIFQGMIVSSAILIIICLYVDLVKPGKYGTTRPWRIWFSFLNIKRERSVPIFKSILHGHIERSKFVVGIKIRNLVKKYGHIVAISDISLDIYKDQITILLGQNGAGKTTLISILTGLTYPTQGTVTVNGVDLFSNIVTFRKSVGLCPQQDVLIPVLSVYEHVMFFGMIKGMSTNEINLYLIDILEKFNLSAKINCMACNLSQGNKRKLCIAIALLNQPSILFLDEPTSGVGPVSRGQIWDILLTLRENRSIIVTTHFMDEADFLGDRIAILVAGEIICYGTSSYLKKHYGSGYNITVTYDNNSDDIEAVVLKYFPSARILNNPPKQHIEFQVPMPDVKSLPKFLRDLERNLSVLGVRDISIACTTVENIYKTIQKRVFDDKLINEPMNVEFDNLKKKGFMIFNHINALIIKRFIWLKRNIMTFIILFFILPVSFTAMVFSKTQGIMDDYDATSFLLELKMYGKTTLIIGNNATDLNANFLLKYFHTGKIKLLISDDPVQDKLLEKGKEGETKYRTSMVIAMDLARPHTVFYSSLAYHSAGIAVNLLFNYLLSVDRHKQREIETYNHPFSSASNICLQPSSQYELLWVSFGIVCVNSLTYFSLFPTFERKTKMKHLQLTAGVLPISYWASFFIVDIVLLILFVLEISLSIYITNSVVFDDPLIFTAVILTIGLYGINMILFSYLISIFIKEFWHAYFILIVLGALCITLNLLLSQISFELENIALIHPLVPFFAAILEIARIVKMKLACKNCSAMKPFCNTYDENTFASMNITVFLIIIGVQAILFGILVLILELPWLHILVNHIFDKLNSSEPPKIRVLDEDVANELLKVKKLRIRAIPDNVLLVVDGLSKSRKQFKIQDMNLIVMKGECFGLLGLSGAGKTTTFSMLTSMTHSKGYIILNKQDSIGFLSRSKFEYLKYVGYCPQENILISELTGRETLQLFARLRGANAKKANATTEKWIEILHMRKFCDSRCKTYSSSAKRKLCIGVALIGDPELILLDEPTNGVDSVERWKLWHILQRCQLKGQTIIMSTNSMEECQALCDRLTVLANGTMLCIGTIQYLRNKFALGYTVIIKLENEISEYEINEVKQEMTRMFSGTAALKEEHRHFLHYHVDQKLTKSTLFLEMERMKLKFFAIDDYMISDTSLVDLTLTSRGSPVPSESA